MRITNADTSHASHLQFCTPGFPTQPLQEVGAHAELVLLQGLQPPSGVSPEHLDRIHRVTPLKFTTTDPAAAAALASSQSAAQQKRANMTFQEHAIMTRPDFGLEQPCESINDGVSLTYVPPHP